MSDLFYLQDSRASLGSQAMFWALNGCGYTSNVSKAQSYTKEQAQSQHNSRLTDVPLMCSLVNELTDLGVDCQYLPETSSGQQNTVYVIRILGLYDGNNIKFVGAGANTYNYNDAQAFGRTALVDYQDIERYEIYEKTLIDLIARPVFKIENINLSVMARKAGIKLNKPKRVRPNTGKVRSNCLECGRVVWNFDPYRPAFCADH
tara:strand:- start:30 stop:641 length:612 start_codon:yes stop_codon:yes gene_type:complete